MQTAAYDKLNDRQKIVCRLLVTMPVGKAAEAARISRDTVQSYKRNPTFRKALNDLRRDSFDDALATIHDTMVGSLAYLVAVRDDVEADVKNRLQAACKLLDFGIRFRAEAELRDKVDGIEDVLRQLTESAGPAGQAGAGDPRIPPGGTPATRSTLPR